ncbi:MAG: hypothetical protein QOE41_2639 [Mycobacterium sp.]|jgi:hypothetical protein|nr:hypothetical protein [Mycobacterium sp.]MDT5133328.1 hypothetical protein [Mycobacterium sp.]
MIVSRATTQSDRTCQITVIAADEESSLDRSKTLFHSSNETVIDG